LLQPNDWRASVGAATVELQAERSTQTAEKSPRFIAASNIGDETAERV